MRRSRALLVAVALLLSACGADRDGDGDQAVFCTRLDRLTDNDPFRAFGPTATAAEVEEAFAALVARAGELQDAAPPEARGATADFTRSAEEMRELLAAVDFDGAAVDARGYRAAQLTYAEASERLLRYLDTSCR